MLIIVNIVISIVSFANSLFQLSNDFPFCDVELSGLFSRGPNVTAFMYNELKRSENKQAVTNSKSISSSAQKIKKLKPTCIETDQAQSKSSRSSAQQSEEVNHTEKSRHIKSSRSSAQQMKEVKRTANGKGQTHSKLKMSSKQQIDDIKRAPSRTITIPRNASDSKIPNHIFWTNEQCPAKQNTCVSVKRTR